MSGDRSPHQLVDTQIVEGRVALVTLLGASNDDKFAWGTRVCEHRINPPLINAVNATLDAALERPAIAAVVVTGQGKFFSNGMDLRWLDTYPDRADELQRAAESLLARILCFNLPTIAAINGHFCAAGAMLGLAFDFRYMNKDKGLFFVPAVDLGLTYSPGMTALMQAKTPVHMHNDMIVFGKRYTATELEHERVVVQACPTDQVLGKALARAQDLTANGRFGTAKYRQTLHNIKRNTYERAQSALFDPSNFQGMGFGEGDWDEHGRSKL